MKEKKLYYNRMNTLEKVEITDENLKSFLQDNYDFEAGFVPEGFNVAMLLTESSDDIVSDQWKIVFFKKAVDLSGSESKAITLDNIDEMDDFEDSTDYSIVKEFDTNFEGTLDTARELIESHKKEVEEKYLGKSAENSEKQEAKI